MSGSGVFWAVVGGFLCGVALRSLVPLGTTSLVFIAVLASVLLLLAFLEREKRRALLFVSLTLFACATGAMRMQLSVQHGDALLNEQLGKKVVLHGVIAQEPDERETSTIITVTLDALRGSTTQVVSGNVLARLPAHSLVHYGDGVTLTGTLELPEAFDTGLGRQFNYPLYLATQGVLYEVSFARASTYGNTGNPLVASVYRIKEAFVAGIRAVLPEPEAGLASGITVGDKRSIGSELSTAFQRDSLLHMVVLSGYNITVVLNTFAWLLGNAPRAVQFSGSIGVVAFFIVVAGGAGSAVRAGLMALIAVLARATHRTYLGGRALAAVAFLMVAWDPFTLVFDPSFQLSGLATLGLITLTPTFSRWFARVPERFGMREILASTCATQTMVLPLLLYQNGMLSFVALPANVLSLGPIPLAMLFSFIAALGGMLFGTYASIIALPAYVLLRYVIEVARFFAALSFAAYTLPAFSFVWVALAYVLLFGFVWVDTLRHKNESGPAKGGAA